MLFIFHCQSPISPANMDKTNVLWKPSSALTSHFVEQFYLLISEQLSMKSEKLSESKINLFAQLNINLSNTKEFYLGETMGTSLWPPSAQPSISERIDLHNLDSCFLISSRSPQHTSHRFLSTSFSRRDGRGNVRLILERRKAELNCRQTTKWVFISRQQLWSKGPKCNQFTNDNLLSTPVKFRSLRFAPKAVPAEPSPDMKTKVLRVEVLDRTRW